jgi:hypothetical protein
VIPQRRRWRLSWRTEAQHQPSERIGPREISLIVYRLAGGEVEVEPSQLQPDHRGSID